MGPKLLFVIGIIIAHGLLAAGWAVEAAPQPRTTVTSCVKTPGSLPDFTPPRELLAMTAVPLIDHGEVMRQ